MKTIQSLTLYIFTLIAPCTLIFLLASEFWLKIVLAVYMTLWGYMYIYIDKILLMILSAREVIDTDEQLLFQRLKSKSYKEQEKMPMVYLYSGHQPNCFLLQSSKNWSIVVEREVLSSMNSEQVEELINYVYEFKRTNNVWLLTKSLGLSVIFYRLIFFFLQNILFLNRKSNTFKILSVFLILLIRPLVFPFEKLNMLFKEVSAHHCLRAVSQELEDAKTTSFLRLLFGSLESELQLRKILISYLEGFSIFRKVKFYEEQF